ncbi:DNA helicase/exodeoxyribonuclease V beta subunit [Desulfobotulus alkaliphilus]|uniref:DNA 3'-5' helicase n=1 Tax=Desulfobotulus alkaliphilus TaxID=622671 RepID=A0A562RHR2_9BACT|nr:exodeoxyribonuclease V subunit beta [Desulfobotulus alkaliphilus]TWI68621.1 DNA helicase/exodeoxyribonuclease V beta subunit [Desulfobotulus alkaliphilus]
MTPMPSFDPVNTPLEGTLLMEASAGTGKTHTIASLFVRLVIEHGLPVERILVVTFTEAASGELKERIYARLGDTLAALEEKSFEEAFSGEMAKRHGKSPEARRRILAAIRNFDRAAIGTIHSFCYRMLRENRFESGLRFDAELLTDAGLLRQNAADDVWRRDVASLKPETAARLLENLTPERLMQMAGRYGAPDLQLLPEGSFRDIDGELQELESRLKKIWREEGASLRILLCEDKALSRSQKKFKLDSLNDDLLNLDNWISGHGSLPEKVIKKLTMTNIRKETKKNQPSPEHEFFDLCDYWIVLKKSAPSVHSKNRALFIKNLVQAARLRESELKEKAGVLTFDDLLLRLRDAVLEDRDGGMCLRIRELFGAALIDEFQDTDPVQYAVFDAVFARAGLPLLLIGDPKQAIYAFRGADVFAYLDAAKKSSNRYTLDYNWRSDPELIEAVNLIFQKNPKAFVLEGMEFHPVKAAPKTREILSDPANVSPFTFWLASSESKMKVGKLVPMALGAVSDEIVRLLSGGRKGDIRIGDKGVEPGDMAVLVRSNREALQTRNFLADRGIPAVIHADGNVLDSAEAKELLPVLAAILHPWNSGKVRRALATGIMGFSMKAIDALNRDEPAFNRESSFFMECRNLWQEKGVFPMLSHLYEKGGVLVRAAGTGDGERQVTNLLHLAEILHSAEVDEKRGPEVLYRWLERQGNPAFPRRVEAPLRLESDGQRVRVITVHRSKGLEYPIVFCPFIHSATDVLGQSNPEKIMAFHDPELENRLCVDFGGKADKAREEDLTRKEAMAEQARLLYVALTRARHRVYAVWGSINNTKGRACNWILHNEADAIPGAGQVKQDMEALSKEGVLACLSLPDDQHLQLPHQDESKDSPVCCTPPHLPADPFRITSFSSLVAGKYMENPADRDGGERPVRKSEDPGGDIFSFPAGARPGNFMHHLFENIDFTQATQQFEPQVRKSLYLFGYDEAWLPAILEMVERVLAMPFGEEGFSLKDVGLKDQLRELDFYYPLNILESDAISKWVKKITMGACDHLPPQLERLYFSRSSGYLRGVMDLVFRHQGKYYLLDWKSNDLGADYGAYSPENLKGEMALHLYTLQYHLYVLALDRYLSFRLKDYDYERDFGGVAYVFLRGVNPENAPGCGLFFEKPPLERIREMAGWMLAEGLLNSAG